MSWLHRILGRKQQQPRLNGSARLQLEQLETRAVPANMTLNFTNLNHAPLPVGDGKFYVAIATPQQHYDPSSPSQFVPNAGAGSVHSYPLPGQVTIPDGFSSGIIVIFAGQQLDLPGGEHPGVPGPTDGTVAGTP